MIKREIAKSIRPTAALDNGIIKRGKYIFLTIPWFAIIEDPALDITNEK